MVDVVERVAREVDLAALALREHHTVVADARMLGTEAAHRDRLHAASAAVVAQRDAWQTVQGVGHVGDTLHEHIVPVEHVHRGRTLQCVTMTGLRHGHLTQRVAKGCLCRTLKRWPQQRHSHDGLSILHPFP